MTAARTPVRVGVLALAACLVSEAQALNIVITNDDGFEASTIHALYRTLRDHGHHVIISSETQDNSGKGGAVDFFRPITTLTRQSRAGSVLAGAPGVGTLPGDENVHYVDSTPVAAALYALDVISLQAWGGAPDLVISGPNYGNNTGLINNSSGTVNAALICLNRGVPAVAVSTAVPSTYKSFRDLKPEDPEFEVGNIVLRLVSALEAGTKGRKRLLPPGVGLNINIPAFAAGHAGNLRATWSHEGTVPSAMPVFVQDLSQDPNARSWGLTSLPALPGVSAVRPGMPLPAGVNLDPDPHAEQNVIAGGKISISVIHGNHQANPREYASVMRDLKMLRLSPDERE